MAAKTVGKLAWHVHHEKLVEVLTEPLSTRVAYIKSSKPKHEIKTRLRLLKLVKWSVPPSLAKAGAAYAKAGAAYDKARAAYDKAGAASDKAWAASDKAGAASDKAGAAYEKALTKHMPFLIKLHAKECPDCPWNGHTIFPAK